MQEWRKAASVRFAPAVVLFVLVLAAMVGAADGPPQLKPLTQRETRAVPTERLPAGVSLGPVIPGLAEGAIPQGLAWMKRQNWLVISYHFEGKQPSMLAVVDLKTGKAVKSLGMLEADGAVHKGHVGGLAASERYLWVGSGPVYRVPLEELVNAPALGYVKLAEGLKAEVQAGCVIVHDSVLWVGEWVPGGTKNSPHYVVDRAGKERYAWACGYRLDGGENPLAGAKDKGQAMTPDYVLVIPEKVQGMAFVPGGIMVSASLGKRTDSAIALFRNVLQEPKSHDTVRTSGGDRVPAWFLDANSLVRPAKVPPMSQNITMVGNRLGVLFESGAEKFAKGGKRPIEHVVLVEVD